MLPLALLPPHAYNQGALSGGRVRFGRWVAQDVHCGRSGSRTVTAAGAAGATLPWDADRMLRPYNASLDHEAESAVRSKHPTVRYKKAATCGPAPVRPVKRVPGGWRCQERERLGEQGVGLLVGVHTSPLNRARRDAIRPTWASYPTNSTLVCFIIGLGGLTDETRGALQTESAAYGDMVLLPGVRDGTCHITMEKAFGWWSWAAGTAVPHIARVDDDTFVHLPTMESVLAPLACHRMLVFGMLAYVGYNPLTFRKCGFGWTGDGPWKRYGCAATGAHEPTLFPSGMLQVLSLPVARAIASSASVQNFVRRASQLIDLSDWDRTEDVALGFWIGQLLVEPDRLPQQQPNGANRQQIALPSVTFVRATPSQAHNLGCQKHAGLYRNPRKGSAAIHYIKRPSGIAYIYRVLGGEQHVGKACTRAAGVG